MTAHDQMKAMLDQLMGTGRNGTCNLFLDTYQAHAWLMSVCIMRLLFYPFLQPREGMVSVIALYRLGLFQFWPTIIISLLYCLALDLQSHYDFFRSYVDYIHTDERRVIRKPRVLFFFACQVYLLERIVEKLHPTWCAHGFLCLPGENSKYQVKFTDSKVCKSFLLACCPHEILSSTVCLGPVFNSPFLYHGLFMKHGIDMAF